MIKQALILLFLMPALSFAQIDTAAYLFAYGGLGNDIAEDIEPTTDGGYIVVGSTASSGDGNTDIYLLKVDSLCNYEWSKSLGGANNDWGYSIKQTHDKGYIIAASSNSYGNSYQACLFKRDSVGEYEWMRTYGGADWDLAYDVVQAYDSGFIFCGETYNNTAGFSDVYVVKTNNVGDTIWTRTIGGSLIDKGNAIIETSDSNIVVAGIRNTVTDSTQANILKLDKNGILLWDSIYGGPAYEWINDLVESFPNNYTVAGSTNSNSNGDLNYYILNVDPQGSQNWEYSIVNPPSPVPDDDELYAIGLMPNNRMLFTGSYKTDGGGKKNLGIITLTYDGLWANESMVLGTEEDDFLRSVYVNSNKRIVGAGQTNSFGNGNWDALILRMDSIYWNNDTIITVKEDIAPIGQNEILEQEDIEIFPNPTSTILNLHIENIQPSYIFQLTDVLGREWLNLPVKSERITIEVDQFPKQVYIYNILEKGKTIKTGKLIIN